MNQLNMGIYVVCVSSQHQDECYSVWVDVLQGEAQVENEIRKILATSPASQASQWVIQDSEGLSKFVLGEIQDLSIIVSFAGLIETYGVDLISEVLEFTRCLPTAVDMMQCYYGEHVSEVKFVEDYAKELYDIPDCLEYYIDYERMADDWFNNHYVSIEVGDSIHVFSN